MSSLPALITLGLVLGAGSASSDCPSIASVREELRSLGLDDSSSGGVSIEDLGPRYRVTVASRMREFDDAPRRCDERARAAAVLVALQSESRPPIRSVALAEATAPSPNPRTVLQLEAAMLGAFMVQRGAEAAPGLVVRIALGADPVSMVLGLGATLPARLHLENAGATLTRVPLELGLRLLRAGDRFSFGGELGVTSGVLWVRGEGLEGARPEVRMDFGVRAATVFQLQLWRSGGVGLPVAVSYFPSPHALVVTGLGPVGTLPAVRLDAGVSVWWKFQ